MTTPPPTAPARSTSPQQPLGRAHDDTPSGRVLGCELVPELRDASAEVLAGLGMPWAEVRQADPERIGIPEEAPFDRILVSAGARDRPEALIAQLAPSGIMVIPVAAPTLRVRESDDGSIEITEHGGCSLVPLIYD